MMTKDDIHRSIMAEVEKVILFSDFCHITSKPISPMAGLGMIDIYIRRSDMFEAMRYWPKVDVAERLHNSTDGVVLRKPTL